MAWLRRVLNTLRPERVRREIDREIAFHLRERAEQLRGEGVTGDEAARRAQRQFGPGLLQAERTRDVDVAGWLDALVRHVRYGLRALARTPLFTLTAVATLALGIGANSAVFSALDAVLLRPLPFPDADRLMRVSEVRERTAVTSLAPVRLEEWHRLTRTFEGITGYYVEDVSDTSGDLPEKVARATVAPRFLQVLGIAPALGRGFTDAEHHTGGPDAIVISDRYWRTRLGSDPRVLERSVRIESRTFPIVGVMPASFRLSEREADLWSPVLVNADYAQHRLNNWFTGIGRLRAGVTPEQARHDLAAVQAQLAVQHPASDRDIGVDLVPLKETTIGGMRESLWLMFGAVTVLLLITCTNVAALLLSRSTQRLPEIAIRLSLGATRAAVAGQVLVETLLLALAGAAIGLCVAIGASAALRAAGAGADLPRLDEIALDGRLLLYTLTVAVAATLICGVLPALRAAQYGRRVPDTSGRTQVSTRHPLQWTLVGAQVALSVTLLAAAGLLLRSFHELSRVDPGFAPERILTFRMSASWAETSDLKGLAERFERTLETLRALPGVDAAATSLLPPGTPAPRETAFELVEARGNRDLSIVADDRGVSPDYFATLGIPLLEGDGCRRQVPRTPRDVVVNRTFAARYLSAWPSPVGLHLARSGATSSHRIVGVVADARERGLDRLPAPTVYWCADWNPGPYFLLRTSGEPLALTPSVRHALRELEPLRAVYDIAPLDERMGGRFTQNRLRTAVLVLFAVTALSLASIGLYGTVSYAVGLRRREIGLRLALGAARREIVGQFLIQGLRVVSIACLAGLALAAAFTQTLAGMLYGVTASDPLTLAGVVGLVMAVAALAALAPAARAARVDPMEALRRE
jgi:putative ABC transport system permease protein